MATTTTCPSCNGPLRIPDELVGQRVRCPACQTIFDAGSTSAPPTAPAPTPPAADPDRPLWKDLQLELDNGESKKREDSPPMEPARRPAPTPAPAPSQTRRLVGAVELAPTGDDPAPPPRREPPPSHRPPGPRDREFPPEPGDDDHPRRGPFDRGPRRRDSEPHRGVLVLVLGIISLVCTVPFCCYGLFSLAGIPLGITAWALGHRDIGRIKRNEMDEEGLGTTQAGWVCGIVGTILNTLVLLSWGAFIAVMIVSASNSAATAPKPAFGVPAAPVPPAPPVPAPPAMKQ